MVITDFKFILSDARIETICNQVKDAFIAYQTETIKDYTTVSTENNARLQLLIDICNHKPEEWNIENFEKFSLYSGSAGLTAEFNAVKTAIAADEAAKYLDESGYNDLSETEKAALSDKTKEAITKAEGADADHKIAATQYAAFLVKCDMVQVQIDRYTALLDSYKASVGTEVSEETGEGGALLGTYQENAFRTNKKRLQGFIETLAKFKELGVYDITTETTFTEPTNVKIDGGNNYKNIDALLGTSDEVKYTSKTGILENIGYVQYCAKMYQEKFLVVFNLIKQLFVNKDDGKDAISQLVSELKALDPSADYSEVAEKYKEALTGNTAEEIENILKPWMEIKKKGDPISYENGHSNNGFGLAVLDDPEAVEWETATEKQSVAWQKAQREVKKDHLDSDNKQIDAEKATLQYAYDEYVRELSLVDDGKDIDGEESHDLMSLVTAIERSVTQLPDEATYAKTGFTSRITAAKEAVNTLKNAIEQANKDIKEDTDNSIKFKIYGKDQTWNDLGASVGDKLIVRDFIEDNADLRTYECTDLNAKLNIELPSDRLFSFYLVSGTDGKETDFTSLISVWFVGNNVKIETAPKIAFQEWYEDFKTSYNAVYDQIQYLAADIITAATEYQAYAEVRDAVFKTETVDGKTVYAGGTLGKRYEDAKNTIDGLTSSLKTLRSDDAADKLYKDSEFLNEYAKKIQGYINAVKRRVELDYGLGTDDEGKRGGTVPSATNFWQDGGTTKLTWQAESTSARIEAGASGRLLNGSYTSYWGNAIRLGESDRSTDWSMPKGSYTFTFRLNKADNTDGHQVEIAIHENMQNGSDNASTVKASVKEGDPGWSVSDDGVVTAKISLPTSAPHGGVRLSISPSGTREAEFTISGLSYTVDPAEPLWHDTGLVPVDENGDTYGGITFQKWTDVDGLLQKLEKDTEVAQTAIKHYIAARTAYTEDSTAIQNVLNAVKDHGVYTDKTSTRTNHGIYAQDIEKLNNLLKANRGDAITDVETPGKVITSAENWDEDHWTYLNELNTKRMYVTEDLDPNEVKDSPDTTHKLIEEWFTDTKIAADKAAYNFAVEEEGVADLYKEIYGSDGDGKKKDGLIDVVLDKYNADKAATYDAFINGVDAKKVFGSRATEVKNAWAQAKTDITKTAKKNDDVNEGAYKIWVITYGAVLYDPLADKQAALATARDGLLGLKDKLDAFNYATYRVDGTDYTNGELKENHISDVQFSETTNLELLKKWTLDVKNAFADNQALYDSLTIDVAAGQRGALPVLLDAAQAGKDKVDTYTALNAADKTALKGYYDVLIATLRLKPLLTNGLRDLVEKGYAAETLRDDFTNTNYGIQQQLQYTKDQLKALDNYVVLCNNFRLAEAAIDKANTAITTDPAKYGEGAAATVFTDNLALMSNSSTGWDDTQEGTVYADLKKIREKSDAFLAGFTKDFGTLSADELDKLVKYDEDGNDIHQSGKDIDDANTLYTELLAVLGTSETTITDPNNLRTVAVDDISAPDKFQVKVKDPSTNEEKTVTPHDMIARELQAAELNKTAYDELNDVNNRLKTRVATILGYLDNPAMFQSTPEGDILKDIINTYYKPVYATMQTRIDQAYNTGKAYWQSSTQTKLDPLTAAIDKAEKGDWGFGPEGGDGELTFDKDAQAKTKSPANQIIYHAIADSIASLNNLYDKFSGNYDNYLVKKNADIFSKEVQKAYEKAFATQEQAVLDIEKFKTPEDPKLLEAFNEAFKRATETIYKAPDALRSALGLAAQNKLDADYANETYAPTTAKYEDAVALFEELKVYDDTEYPYASTQYTDVALIEAIEHMISHEFETFITTMKTALETRSTEVLTGSVNMTGTINDSWDVIKDYYATPDGPTRKKFSDVYPNDGSQNDWFCVAKQAAAQLSAYGVQIGNAAWTDYEQYLEADKILTSKVVTDFEGYMKERMNAAASLDLQNRIEIAFIEEVRPDLQSVEGAVIERTITIGEGDDVQTKTIKVGEPEKDGEGNDINFAKEYPTQYKGYGPADARGNYWSFKQALGVVNRDLEGDPYQILIDELDEVVLNTVGAAELKRQAYDAAVQLPSYYDEEQGITVNTRQEVLQLFRKYTKKNGYGDNAVNDLFEKIYEKFLNGFDYTDPSTGETTHYFGYNQFLLDTDYAYAIEDLNARIDDEIAGITSLYVGTEPERQEALNDIKQKLEQETETPGTWDIYTLTEELNEQIVDAKADDYDAMLEELTKLKNEYNVMIAMADTQDEKDALADKYANEENPTLNIEKNIERIKELQQKLDSDMNGTLDYPQDLSDDFDYADYVAVESNVSKIKAEIAGKTAEDLAAICNALFNAAQALLDTETTYASVPAGTKVLYPENPACNDYKYTDFGLHEYYLQVMLDEATDAVINDYISTINKIKAVIKQHKDAGDILLFEENIKKQIAQFAYGEGGSRDLAELDENLNSNSEDDAVESLYEYNEYVKTFVENQKTQKERLQAEIDAVKALIEPAVATIAAQNAKYIDSEGNEQTYKADMTVVNDEITKIQQRLNVRYLTGDKALDDKFTLRTKKGKASFTIAMRETHKDLVTDEWLEQWLIADIYNAETGKASLPATIGLAAVQELIENQVQEAINLRAQNKFDEAVEAYEAARLKLINTPMRADQKDALLVKFRGQDVSVAIESAEDNSFQARLQGFYLTKDDRDAETIQAYADAIDQFIKDLLGEWNEETEQYEGGFVDEVDATKAGDTDSDGVINALDLAYLQVRVNNPNLIDTEDWAKCDLNNDGYIDVIDLGIMVDILAGGTADDYLYADGVLSARAAKNGGEHLVARVVEREGNTQRIAISLQNVKDYFAFQMDVVLPEGMRLAGQSLSSRASGQNLFANEWKENTVRLVGFTASKSAISGNDGELIYLDVETTDEYQGGNLSYQGILFVTTDTKGQRFQMEGDVVTGIMDRMADAVDAAKEKVYNLGGRLMDGMKKGVNIIRGEKKVVKK